MEGETGGGCSGGEGDAEAEEEDAWTVDALGEEGGGGGGDKENEEDILTMLLLLLLLLLLLVP